MHAKARGSQSENPPRSGVRAKSIGVNAEGKPLEEVAKPLSVIGKPSEAIFRTGAD
jgi:hypothetical protein